MHCAIAAERATARPFAFLLTNTGRRAPAPRQRLNLTAGVPDCADLGIRFASGKANGCQEPSATPLLNLRFADAQKRRCLACAEQEGPQVYCGGWFSHGVNAALESASRRTSGTAACLIRA